MNALTAHSGIKSYTERWELGFRSTYLISTPSASELEVQEVRSMSALPPKADLGTQPWLIRSPRRPRQVKLGVFQIDARQSRGASQRKTERSGCGGRAPVSRNISATHPRWYELWVKRWRNISPRLIDA